MDFMIIGIDHFVQLERNARDNAQMTASKERLEELIQQALAQHDIQAIAEESHPQEQTIAARLSRAKNPPPSWTNIHVEEKERETLGIKKALADRPGNPDPETMTYWIEYRIPEDDILERRYIEKTLDGANGATRILMLVGDAHVDEIAAKLTKMGHAVKTTHEICPVKRWQR